MIIDPTDPKRMFSAFVREGEGQLIAAEFNPEDNSYQRTDIEVVNEQNSIADRILSMLRLNPRGLSGRSIIECLGMSPEEGRGVYTALTRMEAKLLVSTIKSPSDKRVTFYTIKNTQHVEKNTQQNTQQEGDSPSPPHPVSNVEYCSESHKEKDFQDTQQKNQNTQQHTENTQQLLDTSSTDEDLNLLLDIDPSLLLNNFQAGGGRESPQEVLKNCTESLKIQSKVESSNSGWKNCSIKDLKERDRVSCFPTYTHVQRNKPVTATVVGLEADSNNPEYLVQIQLNISNTGRAEVPQRMLQFVGQASQTGL
jgi:DNA-binding transcriptional regulator GbsR (MarR family)